MVSALELDGIVAAILGVRCAHPVRVGIDGFCAAGKSTLAAMIAPRLIAAGRPVIRACGDDFQNPPEIRYQLGHTSPEGFYRHAIDFAAMRSLLLDPLSDQGTARYRTTSYDVRAARPNPGPERLASIVDVLLFDGLFLQAPALVGHLDFTIFIRASMDTCLARALSRNQERMTDPARLEARYRERYVPGFALYCREAEPEQRATRTISSEDAVLVSRPDATPAE
jgi:uridine kinase